jgi:hypothetical protein
MKRTHDDDDNNNNNNDDEVDLKPPSSLENYWDTDKNYGSVLSLSSSSLLVAFPSEAAVAVPCEATVPITTTAAAAAAGTPSSSSSFFTSWMVPKEPTSVLPRSKKHSSDFGGGGTGCLGRSFFDNCGGSSGSGFSNHNNNNNKGGAGGLFQLVGQNQEDQEEEDNGTASAYSNDKSLLQKQADDAAMEIAKEMNRLSLQDREKIYEEVHGVSDRIAETPELIERAMAELESQIQATRHKPAYDMAVAMEQEQQQSPNGGGSPREEEEPSASSSSSYTNDFKFRLAFLRGAEFNMTVAIKGYIGWWEWKLELFGPEKLLQRHIRFKDLTRTAQSLVKSGWNQILPGRDSRGRVVIGTATNFNRSKRKRTMNDVLQMFWYMTMSLVEDETNQHSGYVWINYSLAASSSSETTTKHDNDNNKTKKELMKTTKKIKKKNAAAPASSLSASSEGGDELNNDVDEREEEEEEDNGGVNPSEMFWKNAQMHHCIPIRLEAMHYMISHDIGSPTSHLLAVLAKAISPYVQVRFRVHHGSMIECSYALLGFGVPTGLIPVSDGGELKMANHRKWIQRRIVKDEEMPQPPPQQQQGKAKKAAKAAASAAASSGGTASQTKSESTATASSSTSTVFTGIELPRRADILLGKGKPIQDHPGNQRLRELVNMYRDEYDEAAQQLGGRTAVACRILQEIRSPSSSCRSTNTSTTNTTSTPYREGGRFLKIRPDSKNSGWWEEELDEDKIVEKICNGFRNLRQKTSTNTATTRTTVASNIINCNNTSKTPSSSSSNNNLNSNNISRFSTKASVILIR